MGFTSTFKFINLGIRRQQFRRLKKPHHQWDMMKNMLDSLIKLDRIETTTAKAKELQQYAEELILNAKKDTSETDTIVESMLRTSTARQRLYEVLVPRYRYRSYYFTRIVNQWRFRARDAANMAYIEFVDSPIELKPAKPVGFERIRYIHQQMQSNRRNFRAFEEEAASLKLLDEKNRLIKNVETLKPQSLLITWTQNVAEPEKTTKMTKNANSSEYNTAEMTDQHTLPGDSVFHSGVMQSGPRRGMEGFNVPVRFKRRVEMQDRWIRRRPKP